MVRVEIDTAVELYPEIVINSQEHDPTGIDAGPERYPWEVPDALYGAYRRALHLVADLTGALLTSAGWTYDNDTDTWTPPEKGA